jgi:hypothetical protein
MQKYGAIVLSLVILAAVAAGTYRWADALQHSVFTYQSPLSVARIPPGEPMPAQTRRVVVVVVGGLNYATAYSAAMPNLGTLLEAGAAAPLTSRPPTYPQPAWSTLLTGVWPDLNNAPALDAGTTARRPLVLDHLFAAAHDAGLHTAIAGLKGQQPLLPPGAVDASFYTAGQDAVSDGQVAQAALEFIADPQYNLILVFFSQVGAAGRAEGADSAAYTGAARQVDGHVRQIARLVNLSTSVLIVTADHGILKGGQLGGSEAELTRLPLAMIGQSVIPGDYSAIDQVDLAPTVAALLGTRLPTAAQGRPLYEMIRLDEATLTAGQLQAAAQRVSLGDGYLAAIGRGQMSEATHQDLSRAQQTMLGGNRAGALQLAKLVSTEAAAEMEAAKAARIAGEKLPRLGLATAGVLALLFVLRLVHVWGQGASTRMGLLEGAVATAVYYGLYRLEGYTFSLSTVGDYDAFVTDLVRYAAIGAGAAGLLVLADLLYRDERRWMAALTAGYNCGLLAVLVAALPALWGYWQHGAVAGWYLPDMESLLWHFAALVQVAVVAVLAVPIPWIAALAAWGVGRWRARADRPRPA